MVSSSGAVSRSGSGLDCRPLFIFGPTASGKTAVSVQLAKALNGEVISVDSALIYRGMDIGSAKPTLVERQGVAHALIDIRDPEQAYSAAEFARDARAELERVVARGRVPIFVGGTMLYAKALLEGLSPMPASDERIREAIRTEAERLGWPTMHKKLADVDPAAATVIHPNHSHRISRALEVYRSSGKPISAWQAQHGRGLVDEYDCVQIALLPQVRSALHRRIEQRFDQMIEAGFEQEVLALRSNPKLDKTLPAMRCVGYRQMWEYLDGDIDFASMREKALAATRQLAKRQITWLRSWQNLHSIDLDAAFESDRGVQDLVDQILSCYQSY